MLSVNGAVLNLSGQMLEKFDSRGLEFGNITFEGVLSLLWPILSSFPKVHTSPSFALFLKGHRFSTNALFVHSLLGLFKLAQIILVPSTWPLKLLNVNIN